MGGLFMSKLCCQWPAGKRVNHKLFVPHDALLVVLTNTRLTDALGTRDPK